MTNNPRTSPIPGVSIRFFQQRDATGAESVSEFVAPALGQLLVPDTTAIARQIAGYQPRLTDHAGAYWYRDGTGASGWLRVEGLHPRDIDKIHELMIVEDISAAIGIPEPWRMDPEMFTSVRLRTGNPWMFLGSAVVILGFAIAMMLSAIFRANNLALLITLIFFSAAFVVLGVLLIRRAVQRLPWWNAARAEVRRRGIPMPDKLHGLGY